MTAPFYADIWVGADGRAHVEVPKKRQPDFPAGTHVRVEIVEMGSDE